MIESPHAMNIHESPVTCVSYYSDCPIDLIGALTLVGTKQRNKEFSQRVSTFSNQHLISHNQNYEKKINNKLNTIISAPIHSDLILFPAKARRTLFPATKVTNPKNASNFRVSNMSS